MSSALFFVEVYSLALDSICPTPSATIVRMKREERFLSTAEILVLGNRLAISHAFRVKCAEYWLKLGEADEALRELQALPHSTNSHPAAVKAHVAAIGGFRQRNERAVKEYTKPL